MFIVQRSLPQHLYYLLELLGSKLDANTCETLRNHNSHGLGFKIKFN
jgi:hypothetical protein